jgi:uncharacterized SAM-binding protein YcdF (DUF218 family)
MGRALRWTATWTIVLGVGVAAVVWALWRAVPEQNTARSSFDVILVLGTPSNPDGTPSPEQRERVQEGVRLWRAGAAPRLVLSGAAAHNQWVEAHSMALLAKREGVPAVDIIEEPRAMNTIQNVFYTVAIMKQQGWHSALVVSSWYHLPRAARILAHFPIEWRTAAAPWPEEESWGVRAWRCAREAVYCLQLRWFGFPATPFLPAG